MYILALAAHVNGKRELREKIVSNNGTGGHKLPVNRGECMTKRSTKADDPRQSGTRDVKRRSSGSARSHREARSRAPQANQGEKTLIYGLHAAHAALENDARQVLQIFATENAERRLADAIAPRGVPVTRVRPRDLEARLGSDAVHQGILLECDPLVTADLATIAERAVETGLPILVLDQVTDPHNVGAILRSATVFGAAGLVMTRRHSPPLSSALAKAASGALDLLPVALVQNLAKALAELTRQSFHVTGLDSECERVLSEVLAETAGKPNVIVLGAEGKGLRMLTRESCTHLARISASGPIASLNVSNAGAVALYIAAEHRSGAQK